MKRHDLASVKAAGLREAVTAHAGLAADPFVIAWIARGWPLVARRGSANELRAWPLAVPLGMPLPPDAGRRRLPLLLQVRDIVAISPPPTLRRAAASAPASWLPTLDEVDRLATRYGIATRVYGSLAWQSVTGQCYLTARSDIDLLFDVTGIDGASLRAFTTELAAIEAVAPMRLDGELARDDGAAVAWREWASQAHEVLIKTKRGAALLAPSRFVRCAGAS